MGARACVERELFDAQQLFPLLHGRFECGDTRVRGFDRGAGGVLGGLDGQCPIGDVRFGGAQVGFGVITAIFKPASWTVARSAVSVS